MFFYILNPRNEGLEDDIPLKKTVDFEVNQPFKFSKVFFFTTPVVEKFHPHVVALKISQAAAKHQHVSPPFAKARNVPPGRNPRHA